MKAFFIDLAPANGADSPDTVLNGQGAAVWFDEWINQNSSGQQGATVAPSELHPAFVWWHTLSHRIMNGMAIDSGLFFRSH